MTETLKKHWLVACAVPGDDCSDDGVFVDELTPERCGVYRNLRERARFLPPDAQHLTIVGCPPIYGDSGGRDNDYEKALSAGSECIHHWQGTALPSFVNPEEHLDYHAVIELRKEGISFYCPTDDGGEWVASIEWDALLAILDLVDKDRNVLTLTPDPQGMMHMASRTWPTQPSLAIDIACCTVPHMPCGWLPYVLANGKLPDEKADSQVRTPETRWEKEERK